MKLDLMLESIQGRRPLAFNYNRMVNAGYVGKNQAEVRRHIEELAAKGIPGPKSIPVLFPVVLASAQRPAPVDAHDGHPVRVRERGDRAGRGRAPRQMKFRALAALPLTRMSTQTKSDAWNPRNS